MSEHNDLKTEIRGKHDKFAEAEKDGEKLIAAKNYNVEEIKKCLEKLEKMEDEVSVCGRGKLWSEDPRWMDQWRLETGSVKF